MKQPNRLTISLKIVNRAIHWLAGLIWLTREEQQAAGIIYPGKRRYG